MSINNSQSKPEKTFLSNETNNNKKSNEKFKNVAIQPQLSEIYSPQNVFGLDNTHNETQTPMENKTKLDSNPNPQLANTQKYKTKFESKGEIEIKPEMEEEIETDNNYFHSSMIPIYNLENDSKGMNGLERFVKSNEESKNSNQQIEISDKLLIHPTGKIWTTTRIDHPRRSWASSKSKEEILSNFYFYLLSRECESDIIRDVSVGKEYWSIYFVINDNLTERPVECSLRFYISGFNEFNTIIECVRERGDPLLFDRFFHELNEHMIEKKHVLATNSFPNKPEIQIGIREQALNIVSSEIDFEENGEPFDEEEWKRLEEEFGNMELNLDISLNPEF